MRQEKLNSLKESTATTYVIYICFSSFIMFLLCMYIYIYHLEYCFVISFGKNVSSNDLKCESYKETSLIKSKCLGIEEGASALLECMALLVVLQHEAMLLQRCKG